MAEVRDLSVSALFVHFGEDFAGAGQAPFFGTFHDAPVRVLTSHTLRATHSLSPARWCVAGLT